MISIIEYAGKPVKTQKLQQSSIMIKIKFGKVIILYKPHSWHTKVNLNH